MDEPPKCELISVCARSSKKCENPPVPLAKSVEYDESEYPGVKIMVTRGRGEVEVLAHLPI